MTSETVGHQTKANTSIISDILSPSEDELIIKDYKSHKETICPEENHQRENKEFGTSSTVINSKVEENCKIRILNV